MRNTIKLIKESWGLLRKDPELLLFPLITVLVVTPLSIGFFIVLMKIFSDEQGGPPPKEVLFANPLFWLLIFIGYFLIIRFIILFLKSAQITIAYARFNNQNLSFIDGLRNAARRWIRIFVWTFLSSTVIFILRILERISKKVLIKILATTGEVTWFFATFYVLPVLMFEDLHGFDVLKKSWALFKKTWSPMAIINISFVSIGVILGILLIIPIAILGIMEGVYHYNISSGLFFGVVGPVLIFVVISGIIISALDGIFLTALYLYGLTGRVPVGYSEDLVKNAFISRKT